MDHPGKQAPAKNLIPVNDLTTIGLVQKLSSEYLNYMHSQTTEKEERNNRKLNLIIDRWIKLHR